MSFSTEMLEMNGHWPLTSLAACHLILCFGSQSCASSYYPLRASVLLAGYLSVTQHFRCTWKRSDLYDSHLGKNYNELFLSKFQLFESITLLGWVLFCMLWLFIFLMYIRLFQVVLTGTYHFPFSISLHEEILNFRKSKIMIKLPKASLPELCSSTQDVVSSKSCSFVINQPIYYS